MLRTNQQSCCYNSLRTLIFYTWMGLLSPNLSLSLFSTSTPHFTDHSVPRYLNSSFSNSSPFNLTLSFSCPPISTTPYHFTLTIYLLFAKLRYPPIFFSEYWYLVPMKNAGSLYLYLFLRFLNEKALIYILSWNVNV